MRSSLLFAIFSLLIYIATIPTCESRSYPCKPCRGEACDREPESYCRWGETRNICGYRVCKKGPNARCSPNSHYGSVCGNGLSCIDQECTGCYADDPNGDIVCSDDIIY